MKLKVAKKPEVDNSVVDESGTEAAPIKKGKKGKKLNKDAQEARNDAFNLDKFLEGINARFGAGSVFRASEGHGMAVTHLPTGVSRLDIALGGGIPIGRLIEIYGNESAGKTTLLLSAIASFQKKFPRGISALVDFERSYDANYAARLGVDNYRLILINPDYGEQGCDLINEFMGQPTDVFFGVDSIAAVTASSTLEVSAEKAEVGVHARIINRLFAKCNARMKRNLTDPDYPSTTGVFLNQEREKVGVVFGDPATTPGGKGKNYFASLRLRLFSSGSTKNKIETAVTIGGVKKAILMARKTSFTVVKNKTGGTPFEDGEYWYFIKPFKHHSPWTFDNEEALFEAGRFHRLITVSKKGQFVFSTLSAGKPHLFQAQLANNPDVAEELFEAILDKVKVFNAGTLDDTAVVEEAESEE